MGRDDVTQQALVAHAQKMPQRSPALVAETTTWSSVMAEYAPRASTKPAFGGLVDMDGAQIFGNTNPELQRSQALTRRDDRTTTDAS